MVAVQFLDDIIAAGAWVDPSGHPLEFDTASHPIPAFFDRTPDDGTSRTPLRPAAPDESWLVIKSEECYCACHDDDTVYSCDWCHDGHPPRTDGVKLLREEHEYYGSVLRLPQAVPTPAALPDSALFLRPETAAIDDSADGAEDDSVDGSDDDSAPGAAATGTTRRRAPTPL